MHFCNLHTASFLSHLSPSEGQDIRWSELLCGMACPVERRRLQQLQFLIRLWHDRVQNRTWEGRHRLLSLVRLWRRQTRSAHRPAPE